MKTSLLIAGVGMLVFGNGAALAQGAPPGAGAAPAPGTGDSSAITRANRDQQSGYNSVLNNMEKSKPAKGKPKAVAATAADVTTGTAIRDVNGQPIGKVDSLAADGVVVDTGQTKIKVPLESIGKDGSGLLLGITAQKFGELVAQARAQNETQAQAAAQQAAKEPKPATAADIVAGAALRDADGKPLGKVTSVSTDGATIDTGQTKVKLPLDAFGKDDSGLMIGITAEKLNELIAESRAAKTKQP